MTKRFLTVYEYADLYKVSACSVRRGCNDGSITAVKLGSQWRIPVDQEPESTTDAIQAIASCLSEMRAALDRLEQNLELQRA